MLADNIIERDSLFLRNLNTSSYNTAKDVWTPGLTGYGWYTATYEKKLAIDHYYYLRFTYKFTTTNQSPTWAQLYLQSGYVGGASISNPQPNTEYTASLIRKPILNYIDYADNYGILYNGPSSGISGVTSYAKNVLIYDVTDLYYILCDKGVLGSTSELQTWCDNNLDFVPRYTDYDIREIVANAINDKVSIKDGNIMSTDFVETDGMQYYSVTSGLRIHTYFDTGSAAGIYNNTGNGNVTHTRVSAADQDSPFYPEHKYVLKITTNGPATPGAGGFIAHHIAAANKIFVEKFVAKIPVGYNIVSTYNAQGTGASVTYLTPTAGTGNWEEYCILYKCGSSGSFSNGGHVYLNGTDNTNVTWYLAYVNNCDITGKEYLKNYAVLPNKTTFKTGSTFCHNIDTVNILPNGDFHDISTITLPSGYSWDTEDVAGNAKRSLVQGVNAGGNFMLPQECVAIDYTCKYKFSYWIKCKQDMTSFLTAIAFYTPTGTGLQHQTVAYEPGTKTTLAAPLNTGDTSMQVKSIGSWKVRNYSKVGFRSGSTSTMPSYNDIGISNAGATSAGLVSGVSGNTVNFSTAYTGPNRAAGTVVVESFDGNTYPYPFSKGMLPTDNTWKYIEGYFGADKIWDGSGGGWSGIPAGITKMRFYVNLYKNTGSVPIKYADFRIEKVTGKGFDRLEKKIQLEK